MHIYSTGQWVLLFYFYCFCGWIWETCYVSAKQHRWVNRGFLNGPLLPIYGSGAIIILFATLPVQENLYLVWLLGMLAATALEYITGAAMESIFKVRYWDYSYRKIQLNGYICLVSSIAWGFFSILMVQFIHPPVARLLSRVPAFCVDPLALAITAVFSVDVVESVRDALDLRATLIRLTEENEELRRLAKRVEVAAAFAEDDLRRFRAKTELDAMLVQEKLESDRQAVGNIARQYQEILDMRLKGRQQAKLEILEAIEQAMEHAKERLETAAEEKRAERHQELTEIKERIRVRRDAIHAHAPASYRRSMRILRNHPSAKAGEFTEALEALRELLKK